MKRLSLTLVLVLSMMGVWAQQRTVAVQTAGTLGELISSSERSSLNSLKVSGSLNGSDILVLREMAKSHLADLDLADASVVSGGACYYPVGSDQDAYTQDDRFTTRFFYGCTALRTITIPKTLMSVSNDAFANCPNLVAINAPSGSDYFTSVDGILFNASMERVVRCPQAKALTEYEVPAGVIEVYPGAFRNVKTLHSVTLPASVWSISDFAFAGCPLQTIRCKMTRASIGLAFDDAVYASARVIVPKGSASDFKSVDGWNKFKNFVEE